MKIQHIVVANFQLSINCRRQLSLSSDKAFQPFDQFAGAVVRDADFDLLARLFAGKDMRYVIILAAKTAKRRPAIPIIDGDLPRLITSCLRLPFAFNGSLGHRITFYFLCRGT